MVPGIHCCLVPAEGQGGRKEGEEGKEGGKQPGARGEAKASSWGLGLSEALETRWSYRNEGFLHVVKGEWLSCSVPPGKLGEQAPELYSLLPMGDRLCAEYHQQRGAKEASGQASPSNATLLLQARMMLQNQGHQVPVLGLQCGSPDDLHILEWLSDAGWTYHPAALLIIS